MDDKYKARFAAKWSEDVANRGFAPIPKCLITCMGDLDLQPQEAAILFNIIEKCWKAGDVSWQKVDTMATNIGRKNSATRVITNSLAKKGFITKTQRYDSSNIYDLVPLIGKLDKHMKDCRHTARKLEGGSQNFDSRGSQKTSDYIELSLSRTNNLEYSHIVNNNDDMTFLDDNKSSFSKYTCTADQGNKHEWDEPFYEEKPANKNGEEVTWEYRTCLRCGQQFHEKLKYEASQKTDWQDSWDYKDYIQPFIFKTPEEETLYSQFTKETDKRISFLEWVEKAKDSYPCFLNIDFDIDDDEDPHIWETYEGEKSVNQFGEELVWKYWHCTRCNEMFHRRISIDVLNNYYEMLDMSVTV